MQGRQETRGGVGTADCKDMAAGMAAPLARSQEGPEEKQCALKRPAEEMAPAASPIPKQKQNRKRKRKLKLLEEPKKPRTQYAMFVKENYTIMKEAIADTALRSKHLHVMQKLRDKWMQMQPQEKHVYAKMAAQDSKRYHKDYDNCVNRIIDEALEI